MTLSHKRKNMREDENKENLKTPIELPEMTLPNEAERVYILIHWSKEWRRQYIIE